MKNIKINGYNNLELNCYLFEAENPKGVVQIVHGMQEHALRYIDFANFLVYNGYVVLVSDLRGHGKTAQSKEKFGFGEQDIFAETVEDQIIINKFLKEKYKLPVYVFGHSYGSFITQRLAQGLTQSEKFIFCGTANGDNILFSLGKIAAGLAGLFGGKDKPASFVESLSIKGYGKKFENGNWLSRDEKVWEAYQQDEMCGGTFPVSFYQSMFKNLKKLNDGMENISSVSKLFLIVGDKDPVGSNAKQVIKLHEKYLKNGVNASLKVYEDCRHELLNETNKEEVYNDVLDFLNEK